MIYYCSMQTKYRTMIFQNALSVECVSWDFGAAGKLGHCRVMVMPLIPLQVGVVTGQLLAVKHHSQVTSLLSVDVTI